MIELFSLSIIRYINSKLDSLNGVEVYLSDSNDSQNAIAFTHESGIIYWQLSVNVETNKVVCETIYLDTDYQKEFDERTEYDTLKTVVEKMLYQINQLK